MWLSTDIIEAHGFCLQGPMRSGGQSLFYKALHTATGEHVALKLLAPGLSDADGMLQEAATMATVRHPHIARLVAMALN